MADGIAAKLEYAIVLITDAELKVEAHVVAVRSIDWGMWLDCKSNLAPEVSVGFTSCIGELARCRS